MTEALYKPLTSKTSARFLTLHPGRFYDPLVATLKESKPKHVRYEAISYTWGPPHPEESITINGHELPIRQNLANCFRYIRYEDRKRRLWVDAFSISQTDVEEKNYQVANIGRIFNGAMCTLAWIGEHNSYSKLLFKKVAIDSMGTTETTSKGGILRTLFGRNGERRQRKDDERFENARMNLKLNPYWERRWVMQELILAPNVLVVCGKYSAELESFLQTMLPFGPPMASLLDLRHEYYQDGLGKKPRSLIELCLMFRDTECLEPRDKVYALFQMSAMRDTLKPDYGKSVEQLLFDVLFADLEILEARLEDERRETLSTCEESRLPALLERWDLENFLFVDCLAESLGLSLGSEDVDHRERVLALALCPDPVEDESSRARRRHVVATLRKPVPPMLFTLEGFRYKLEFLDRIRATGESVNSPPRLIPSKYPAVSYFM